MDAITRWDPVKEMDPGKVNAEFKDGVLKVRLPESEKTKPKSIEVKVD
jgi:HSP20 family protein